MAKVSITIPTYNEKNNLSILVNNLLNDCHNLDVELIVVDDNSPDGTGKLADDLAKSYPIKVIHRPSKLGLSSAIISGWNNSTGNILGVIDADLSHPTDKVPEMINCIINKNIDVVIGSRLIKGGGVEEWPIVRKIISLGATKLAWPLTKVRDPLSGFFFFRKDVIDGVKLNPIGYKILLEILVKGKYMSHKEVPYIFLSRTLGSSKLDLKEHINYLIILARLYRYKLLKK